MTNTLTPTAHPAFTAILKDGIAVAVVRNDEVLYTMHRLSNQSIDWAVAHEGFELVTEQVQVNGWYEFDLASKRPIRGITGLIARQAVDLAATIDALESKVGHGEWRDYVAGPELAAMLEAFIGLLTSTDGAPAFDAIRGQLDAWARATGTRIGYPVGE